MTVFTIGHSTREFHAFLALLHEHGIRRLVDVRRFPRSRRYPGFTSEALQATLPAAGLTYLSVPELGGRRRPLADSRNTAWRSPSFRGYADYLATDEFSSALQLALRAADQLPTALMCAEAVPWRCHRQLIADVLVARGTEVRHIIGAGAPSVHVLNPALRVDERGRMTYPAAPGS